MSEPAFERVGIIGLGQMGASIALAIKSGGMIGHISGYDREPDHSATALSMEAIDALAATPEEAVTDADLVILCTPVGAYGALTRLIAPHLKEGAILTDIGSIKAQAIKDITEHLPCRAIYVPSHPIAGSEKVGPYTARGDYFVDHLFLITPYEEHHADAKARIRALWQSTGAIVNELPADAHDRIYAYMSHMPQLMAFAAMTVLDLHGIRLGEDEEILRRFTRIGRSDPHMWRDVFMENAHNTLDAARATLSILSHMREELASGSAETQAEQPDAETTRLLLTGAWARILASSLVMAVSISEQQTGQRLAPFAAGGFRDFTAPATQEPEADFELVSRYAHAMLDALDAYMGVYQRIVDYLADRDSDHLLAQLAVCQACGKRVLNLV